MSFEVPDLPYDYSALEPYIDEETMRIHHDKHHAAYVNMLNGAVEAAGIKGKTVKELITDLDSVPEAQKYLRFRIFTNVWNFTFFDKRNLVFAVEFIANCNHNC